MNKLIENYLINQIDKFDGSTYSELALETYIKNLLQSILYRKYKLELVKLPVALESYTEYQIISKLVKYKEKVLFLIKKDEDKYKDKMLILDIMVSNNPYLKPNILASYMLSLSLHNYDR